MRSPSSLLLVVIQALVVRFGPLCFAGGVRLQQSTSQGLCAGTWCCVSFMTQVISVATFITKWYFKCLNKLLKWVT